MNTLPAVNTHFILEASLDDLHKETKEWLSEIDFWNIELSFFKKLILIQLQEARGWEKDQLEKFLKLSNLEENEIAELKEFIMEHERYLYNLIQNKAVYNDKDYRDDHYSLSVQIRDFDQRFKKHKKQLYLILD